MEAQFVSYLDSSTPARRILLAVGASLPFFLLVLAIHEWALRSPAVSPYLDIGLVRAAQWPVLVSSAINLGVALWVWPRRDTRAMLTGATRVVCITIGLTYTLITILSGPYTAPPSLVLLGVLMVGLQLFERGPVALAFGACVALLLANDIGVLCGVWPYAPALRPALFQDPAALLAWRGWRTVVFVGGFTVLMGLALMLFARVDQLHAKLEALSHTDPLTGLANRRRLMEALEAEVARQRRTGRPFCLVMVDADHFKRVNDRWGHQQGDEVLRVLGQLLMAGVRSPTDLAARLGGRGVRAVAARHAAGGGPGRVRAPASCAGRAALRGPAVALHRHAQHGGRAVRGRLAPRGPARGRPAALSGQGHRPGSGVPAGDRGARMRWPGRLCREQLAQGLLVHRDAHGVLLFVLGSWPMLAVLWLLQTIALLGDAGTRHFHRPGLLVVHAALTGLMGWLLWMARLAWVRRRTEGDQPVLVRRTVMPTVLGVTLLGLAYGLTDTPMAMVLMAQLMLARAVFSWAQLRRAVISALCLVVLVGLERLVSGRDLSPMLRAPIFAGGAMAGWWQVWTRVTFVTALGPYAAMMFFYAGVFARRQRALETLVSTDGLTGLLGRRVLLERLAREAHRQARSGRPLTVVMFDIDHFKLVNDRHGHPAGDEVLATFGRMLRENTREHVDTAARYGGEEFVLLLPETELAGGERVAAKVCARLRAHPFTAAGTVFHVTASAGVAQVVGGQGDAALRLADARLYDAKRAGRDRVVGGTGVSP